MAKQILVILNPASAAGRTGRQRNQIISMLKERLGTNFSLQVTKTPHDAIEIARRGVLEGTELIIAVGGDGTINEVVNGMYEKDQPIDTECMLGIIANGTSSGFAQSLNFPKLIEEQIDVIREKSIRAVDLCKITYTDFDNKRGERYFINECQIGIGGTIVKKVQQSHKVFGGRIAFGWVTLVETFRDKSKNLTITIDDKKQERFQLHGLTVANGVYMGGGMKLAPKAKLDDGLLDLLMIHEQGIAQRFLSYTKIYSGKHIMLGGFSYLQCKSVSVHSVEHAYVGTDGEILGKVPCDIEFLPNKLRVCSPKIGMELIGH